MIQHAKGGVGSGDGHVAAVETGQPDRGQRGGHGQQRHQGGRGELAAGEVRDVGERRDVHDPLVELQGGADQEQQQAGRQRAPTDGREPG